MERWKTRTKLLVLTGLVICIFLGGIWFLYHSWETQMTFQWADENAERGLFLGRTIEILSEQLRAFDYDYSYWDEMVAFAESGDTTWGHENINTSLETYHADAAWVFTPDGRLTYMATAPGAEALRVNGRLDSLIHGSLTGISFGHFFTASELGLLEIRVAPVQPTADNARVTPARGYFVTGRLWTQDVLTRIGEAVQAEIRIDMPGSTALVADNVDEDRRNGVLHFTYPLYGIDGKPAAVLVGHALLPLLDDLKKVGQSRMIFMAVFVLGIMLVLTYSLHRWVSMPLGDVMEGLRTGDHEIFDRVANSSFEFERIGELATEFLTQKTDLEAEIADRRRSEEELRVSETRFRMVTEQTGQMIYDWDCASGAILWTGAITAITGFTTEEYRRVDIKEWERMIHPDDRRAACNALAVAAKQVTQYSAEYRFRKKDGSYTFVEDNGVFVAGVSGKAMRMLGTMKDISERKRSEETLLDRERLLKATLESAADGILVVDHDGEATHWNARFVELWGIPEAVMATRNDEKLLAYVADQVRHPEDFLRRVHELYRHPASSTDVIEFTDGRSFERYSCPLIRDGHSVGRVWSFSDITPRLKAAEARQQLQEQLERAQRYESLGLLAGGVAHDLNNMLGPIGGYAELLLRELPAESAIAARMKKIIKSSEDAAAVIQDLLTLARRGRYEFQVIDLNHVVNHYLESAGCEKIRERFPAVTLRSELHPDGGYIVGSESHLMKVIMNLITNAFEAMPSTGGTVTVRTEIRRLTALDGGYGPISEGEYVVLRVKDDGAGIAKDDLEKIFEPYFSKKHLGHSGSGLGLAVVYGIVKDHHGYYDVFSTPGSGTEFILYFQLSKAAVFADEADANVAVQGRETVLVVDDSAEQRELAQEIAAGLGYTVYTAENGHRAAEFMAGQPVDILVLDMIMEPGFDGLDTYREIVKVRPGQKAIVVSGYSETGRIREMMRLGAGGFLKKPYRVDDLAMAIRKELDRKPPVV